MKPLTISDRVDRLLLNGVGKPKTWAAVHGYEEPDPGKVLDSAGYWSAEWNRLRAHHLEETGFLFEVIGELVKRVNMADEQLANCVLLGGEDD